MLRKCVINYVKGKDHELYNYLSRIKSSLKFYLEIAKIFIFIFNKKYILTHFISINKKVYKFNFKKKLIIHSKKAIELKPLPSFYSNYKKEQKKLFSIVLASKTFHIKKSNEIDWNYQYIDDEDTMALHRFSWLLLNKQKIELKKYANFGMELIYDWINKNIKSKSNLKWDSYTSSERLIYWVTFLSIVKDYVKFDKKKEKIIYDAIIIHLDFIYKNLDFWGQKSNNHLLNNGRALYIGGGFLQNNYSIIGKKILMNETDKLVPNGVLREGSSHYQLLITKSYLELLIYSNTFNDFAFTKWLEIRIDKMLSCSRIFQVKDNNKYSMPLIGDISPDYKPHIFFGWPFVNVEKNEKIINSKWYLNWENTFLKEYLLSKRHQNKHESLTIKNQWVMFKKRNLIIFSHLIKKNIYSHTHQDEGSFCLFFKNKQIIIDPGQKNYLWKDKINSDLVKGYSHNSITLDGFSSNISKVSNLYEYIKRNETLINEYKNGFELIINGFKANGRWVEWIRLFNYENKRLLITDKINTKPKERINLNLNFNRRFNIKNINSQIFGEDDNISFTFKSSAATNSKKLNIDYDISDSYQSDHYGNLNKSNILKVSLVAEGTVEIKSELNFN